MSQGGPRVFGVSNWKNEVAFPLRWGLLQDELVWEVTSGAQSWISEMALGIQVETRRYWLVGLVGHSVK